MLQLRAIDPEWKGIESYMYMEIFYYGDFLFSFFSVAERTYRQASITDRLKLRL